MGDSSSRARAGTVTRVEIQQKRRDRVNVYLDDEFAFAVSLLVAEDGVRRGLALTVEDARRLLAREDFRRAYDSALNFISFRPRSESEVRDNLREKGIAPELADQVIAKLKDARLIDDAAFARFWVENRDAFSPRGARALKSELRGKGLDRELIDEAVEPDRDEGSGAYAAGSKKARELRGVDYRTFRQRLGSYLARRGFDYGTAAEAVEKLWRETRGETDES